MEKNWQRAERKAKELGASSVGWIINWMWATAFPTPEAGKAFVAWLDGNGIENRGYCPAYPDAENPNLRVDGVRFR